MWALPLPLLLPLTLAPRLAQGYQDPDPLAVKLIAIARHAITETVTGGKLQNEPKASDPAKPVFVTIERNGRILGCRGSLVVRHATLAEEVTAAAVSAASHDPRYRPIQPSDLKDFLVTVTLVDQLEPIADVGALAPSDGLVLKSGSKTGVVLPWEGKDPQTRLAWAYKKAGVPPGSAARLERLIARRWRG